MAKNFSVDRNRNKNNGNIFTKTKTVNKTVENLTKSEKLMNGIALWTSFYRANPHRFAEEYLNINLSSYNFIFFQ